jgi:hypothetical protein
MGHSSARGRDLEKRVEACIRRLELLDLATDIQRNVRVRDRVGIQREVDIEFTLKAAFLEIRVSAECKSRSKTITIADIDQIIQYRASLPHRNIFWLIVEGTIGKNAAASLASNGITVYDICELENTVNEIIHESGDKDLDGSRRFRAYMSVCWPYGCSVASEAVGKIEISLIRRLRGVSYNVLRLHGACDKINKDNVLLYRDPGKKFDVLPEVTEDGMLKDVIGKGGRGSVRVHKTDGTTQGKRTFPRSRDRKGSPG